jgi:hypothetical protein
MGRFAEWLLLVEQSLVDPAVLDSYEQAFQQGLEALIQRTHDPELRQTFEGMRGCPVQGRDKRCSRFVDYILGALMRSGCHHEYDVEDALQRIVFRMLSPVGESGARRRTIFDFDETRPFDLRLGNPIEVLFKVYLANEIRNILGGRIPALRTRQKTGTLTIGYGGDSGEVSPDEIPDRMPSGEQEMFNDILSLLKTSSTPEMPLVDLFMSIMRGEGTRAQRSRFGYSKADMMRKTIVQVIGEYAQRTQNWQLLRLLDRFRDFSGNRPDPTRKPLRPPKPPKPVYPPDEQDYRSIVDVLEKHGRSVSMMILGKVRRRWLERPPRDPASVHPNRLADVLARMIQNGVLVKQGARYVPGPEYGRYLGTPEPLGVG